MIVLFLFLLLRPIFLFAGLLECPTGLELRCNCDSFAECCSCVPKEFEICGEDLLLACTGEVMTRRCCRCIKECPYGFSTKFSSECILDCVLGNGTSPCCRCSIDEIEEELFLICPEGYLMVGSITCKDNEELDCVNEDDISDTACCKCSKIEQEIIQKDVSNVKDEDIVAENFNENEGIEEKLDPPEDDSILLDLNKEKELSQEDKEDDINDDDVEFEDWKKILNEEITLESRTCPSGFTKNLNSCPSSDLLEIECISTQRDCCRCVPRKCPTDYIFHSLFQKCDEEKGWINECLFFDSPHNNICCQCQSTTCPDPAYPTPGPDSSSCPTGQVRKCDSNFSGGKLCCGCFHPECPSGDFSTSVRQCGIGYEKECKGFHDRKRCCRCVPNVCEEGYLTDVKDCQVGYKTCSGYSGESSCCRCNTLKKDGKSVESFCPDGFVDIDLYNFDLENSNNNNNEEENINFCGVGEYTSCLSNNNNKKNDNEEKERRSLRKNRNKKKRKGRRTANNNNETDNNGVDELDDWEDYSSCCKCEKICPEGYSTQKITSDCEEGEECVIPVNNFMMPFLPGEKGSGIHGLRIEDASFCCKCASI